MVVVHRLQEIADSLIGIPRLNIMLAQSVGGPGRIFRGTQTKKRLNRFPVAADEFLVIPPVIMDLSQKNQTFGFEAFPGFQQGDRFLNVMLRLIQLPGFQIGSTQNLMDESLFPGRQMIGTDHFQGLVQIMDRLFAILQPEITDTQLMISPGNQYFGELKLIGDAEHPFKTFDCILEVAFVGVASAQDVEHGAHFQPTILLQHDIDRFLGIQDAEGGVGKDQVGFTQIPVNVGLFNVIRHLGKQFFRLLVAEEGLIVHIFQKVNVPFHPQVPDQQIGIFLRASPSLFKSGKFGLVLLFFGKMNQKIDLYQVGFDMDPLIGGLPGEFFQFFEGGFCFIISFIHLGSADFVNQKIRPAEIVLIDDTEKIFYRGVEALGEGGEDIGFGMSLFIFDQTQVGYGNDPLGKFGLGEPQFLSPVSDVVSQTDGLFPPFDQCGSEPVERLIRIKGNVIGMMQ